MPRQKQFKTFPDQLEEIEEAIFEWFKGLEDIAVSTLMPDGRPFGMEKRTQRDQLRQYMDIRGRPDAWLDYLDNLTQQVEQTLSQLPDEYSAAIDAREVAVQYARSYSRKMESIAEREQQKAEAALRPSARPSEPEDDEIEDEADGAD